MAKKKEKDPAAQALVKKRWDKTSAIKRKEIARGLAQARWGKRGKKSSQE